MEGSQVFNETMLVDKWGYLVGVCMLFVLWILFYSVRSDLRPRILMMSFLLLPLAPFGQYYFLKDYWHPPLILSISIGGLTFGGLADFLFTFSMGGIATAAFPMFRRLATHVKNTKPGHWIVFAFLAIEGICIIVLTQFLHLNSIFSSSIGFALSALIMLVIRLDLFKSIR